MSVRSSPENEERWLTRSLRAAVYALGGLVFALPISVPAAVLSCALGAALGSELGLRLARSRLRLHGILAAALVLLGLAALLRSALAGSSTAAQGLGPAGLLQLSEAVGFGTGAVAVATALRSAAARWRSLAVLEVATVAAAFAQLVAAHRQGAINRPFEIADPIIEGGGDPAQAFLALGALTAALVLLLLLSERRFGRALLHLAVVAALVLLVAGTANHFDLLDVASQDALGLRGKAKKKPDKRGEKAGGGKNKEHDPDFRDDYEGPNRRVPVAVVLLHDDYSPPGGLYYFRQGAFSQFNGRRLVRATRGDVDKDIARGFAAAPMPIADVPNEAADRATLDTTVVLMTDHIRPFGLESPVRMEPAANPNPGRFRRAYRVTSLALTSDTIGLLGRSAGDRRWSSEQRRHYLGLPEDARYRELAQQILADIREDLRQDPVVQALAIGGYLSKEGIYSLKSRHAHASDPTADFLFGDKTGYCVHFAHAATYLMRALALPARVATGYLVEEAARQGGSAILLAGENAHAWPEVYLEGVGWVIVDLFPERALDPPMQPPDPDLQRLLGQMARGERPMLPSDERSFQPLIAAARKFAVQAALALVIGLALGLCLLYLVKLWRRLAPRFAKPQALPRVAYRAELDRLAENALRRRQGESRERFATRLKGTCPSFQGLTARHIAAAFGSRRQAAATELRQQAQSVKNELRRALPWWRRMVGVITPWSWLQAR